MILLIDNYDSFVFNLARYLQELGVETEVVRNDAESVTDVLRRRPQAIVLSPGPCTPRQAGICEELVRSALDTVPILGVCLGHQAIVTALGGSLRRAPQPVHGRVSRIRTIEDPLFVRLPNPLQVGRYHSLVIAPDRLPESLQAIAETDDGIIMAVRHKHHPVYGVQFHPESVLTEGGHQLLANFLSMAGISVKISGICERLPVLREDRESGEIFPNMPVIHW